MEYAAFAPQLVDPARNTERGTGADGALVDFAIVPDKPDHAGCPVLREPHTLARVSRAPRVMVGPPPLAVISLRAAETPDIRLFGSERFIDVFRCHAEFLGI